MLLSDLFLRLSLYELQISEEFFWIAYELKNFSSCLNSDRVTSYPNLFVMKYSIYPV